MKKKLFYFGGNQTLALSTYTRCMAYKCYILEFLNLYNVKNYSKHFHLPDLNTYH